MNNVSVANGITEYFTRNMNTSNANVSETCASNVGSNNTLTVDENYWAKLTSLLDAKIKVIENKLDAAVKGLGSKIETLQIKCMQYEEDISTLKAIAVKQQKSLN